jgi:ParB-like chromosome segregation protein Spo0J
VIRYHTAIEPLLTPVDTVTPDPRNANNGDVDAIIASIIVNGCYRPIYASSLTREIVAGHHLYAALLEMGAGVIPVQWIDGDREQATRILLADNEIARLAKMDYGLLVELLDNLAETEKGLAGTGFTADRHDELRLLALDRGGFHLPEIEPDPMPHRCPECQHEWFGPCTQDTEV